VVLGEGGIQLGLHGGSVLPGLYKLVLQRLGPKHSVAVPLKHLRLQAGPFSDVLQRQFTLNGYSTLQD
jgi:hypothetical protein